MKVLFGYTVFLVLIGMALGLSGPVNNYLKIVKMTLPLALFYTTPRLIRDNGGYAGFFGFIFLVSILGFTAQIISLTTGFNPAMYSIRAESAGELEVGRNFRVLYNEGITLLSISGALYYLAFRKEKPFSDSFLFLVAFLCFATAFLSATRGWILSFGFMIGMFFVFVRSLSSKMSALIVVAFLALTIIMFSGSAIGKQIQFSIERLTTLESLAEGDLSAGGTLIRLDERGPRVMSAWAENPVFGAGFSDLFLENQDFHVGNQNVMMHSGVVGYSLMILFFLFLILTMFRGYKNTDRFNPYKLCFLALTITLPGWFMLHSSSQQLFAFYGLPMNIIPQAAMLGLMGLTYQAGYGYDENDEKPDDEELEEVEEDEAT